MKRIVAVMLCIVCLFALFFKLSGTGEDWTPRKYVSYVLENVKPFPKTDLTLEIVQGGDIFAMIESFLKWLFDLIGYPFEVLGVCVRNVGVVLYGLFPIGEVVFDGFGGSGGSGTGGGGGGAR